MTDGWDASAAAWIAAIEDGKDYSREWVLDRPMLERVGLASATTALDVGCGEGRFCRKLRARGMDTIGIDPTEALLAQARALDPGGDYRQGRAEALDFPGGAFDLVVSYLTLIDIPDVDPAIAEMARVLRPGGTLLIANLASFVTASPNGAGWIRDAEGRMVRCVDDYLDERELWMEWKGIRIRNFHRPLSRYMAALLAQGLVLRYFDEPRPYGGDPDMMARYTRVPWHMIMEWQKPAG